MADSQSYSALSDYRDCQTKYRYGRRLGLVQRGAGYVNHDMRYGSAAHVALAQLYSGASLRAVGESFILAYPQNEYPEPLPATAKGKSQNGFLKALWRYINTQWMEDKERWEVLEVELPHSTEGLGEYDHILVLDLLVRDRLDGLVWGVDHKITGNYLDDKFWGRHELSSQVRMYVDDIRQRFGSCGGFVINAISLRHRDRAYTPCKGPDKGVQLPAGDHFAFGRMTYRPNEDCLRLERHNIAATTDDIRRSIETDTWSYNTARCHGNTPYECPFYQICKLGWDWPRDRFQIEEYYRQRCGQRIIGDVIKHCGLDRGHDGDCSPIPPDDAVTLPTVVIEPEDDPYFMSVED